MLNFATAYDRFDLDIVGGIAEYHGGKSSLHQGEDVSFVAGIPAIEPMATKLPQIAAATRWSSGR